MGAGKSYLVGGWATPLKNMKVNWDDYFQYIWKNRIHVLNHQPDMVFTGFYHVFPIHSWCGKPVPPFFKSTGGLCTWRWGSQLCRDHSAAEKAAWPVRFPLGGSSWKKMQGEHHFWKVPRLESCKISLDITQKCHFGATQSGPNFFRDPMCWDITSFSDGLQASVKAVKAQSEDESLHIVCVIYIYI